MRRALWLSIGAAAGGAVAIVTGCAHENCADLEPPNDGTYILDATHPIAGCEQSGECPAD